MSYSAKSANHLSSLFHQSAIFVEQLSCRVVLSAWAEAARFRAIRQVDEVGLLPDEIAAHVRRGLTGLGVGHLHPSQPLKPCRRAMARALFSQPGDTS
jgi:hypothetical protein